MFRYKGIGQVFCIFSLLSLSFIITSAPVIVQAATVQELQEKQRKAAGDASKYRDLQVNKEQEANKYEMLVEQTEDTIHEVEHAIESTVVQVSTKEKELAVTDKEISKSKQELDTLKQKQNEAIVTLYELSNISTIEMVAGADMLSHYGDRIEYLDAIQTNTLSLIKDTSQAKAAFENTKNSLEQKKTELSSLKEQQKAQQSGLEQEKQQKSSLLMQANKQAETYDKLANEAEAKKQEFDRQIAAALRATKSKPGSVVRKGRVKKGDIIGYMGNSGYSTGAHLHFSTIQNSEDYVNPRNVVGKNGTVWPFDSYYVSQEFGKSTWASKYAWHNGMDMVAKAGYGTPIRAMADGEIIEPFPNYNGWMPGGYGRYVVIDHGNGLWSLYGHMINQ